MLCSFRMIINCAQNDILLNVFMMMLHHGSAFHFFPLLLLLVLVSLSCLFALIVGGARGGSETAGALLILNTHEFHAAILPM